MKKLRHWEAWLPRCPMMGARTGLRTPDSPGCTLLTGTCLGLCPGTQPPSRATFVLLPLSLASVPTPLPGWGPLSVGSVGSQVSKKRYTVSPVVDIFLRITV